MSEVLKQDVADTMFGWVRIKETRRVSDLLKQEVAETVSSGGERIKAKSRVS